MTIDFFSDRELGKVQLNSEEITENVLLEIGVKDVPIIVC